MQGIVFIYEEKRSRQNKLLTVRIEERRKKKDAWVPAGPRRVYRAKDLQVPGIKFMDKELFSMAFKSEMDLRQTEGRFFSLDEEYTLFRISPYDLKRFLKRCLAGNILCKRDGFPARFTYKDNVIPEIRFEDTGEKIHVCLWLEGHRMTPPACTMVSSPVRILSGRTIFELTKGLPPSLVGQLLSKNGMVLEKESARYHEVLKKFGQYAGSIRLRLPGKETEMIRNAPVTPVINFSPDLKFADLGFMYEGIEWVSMDDKRKVLLIHEKNRELHRNFSEEKKYEKDLKALGARYRASDRGAWFIPERKRQALIFRLRKKGYVFRISKSPLIPDINIRWDLRADNNRISVGGQIEHKQQKASLENLLDAYLNNQSWFDLPEGDKGLISHRLAHDLEQLSLRGDFRDDDICFQPCDIALVDQIFEDRPDLSRDKGFDQYAAFLKMVRTPDVFEPVPNTLKAELRPYQNIGFSWLSGLYRLGFSGILADDMGLGKTLQVLALLLHLKKTSPHGHKTLLILPKTLIWNWESEILKFAPCLKVLVHAGATREKSGSFLSGLPGPDLVITSYGLVRQDEMILKSVSWDLLVLDEAQAIKNPGSRISGSVKALNAACRLSLTGTPVENRPLDLWSQFDFLMPGFLGSKTDFQQTYAAGDLQGLNRLKRLTSPFILRRLKNDVCLELPPKTEIVRFCDFTREQKACYQQILSTRKDKILSGSVAGDTRSKSSGSKSSETKISRSKSYRSMQILALLLRLRQAACHPALLPETQNDSPLEEASGKFKAVLETALEILGSGHKILIFSQFVALLELADAMFKAHGIDTHTLYGATTNRKEVIRRFKKKPVPLRVSHFFKNRRRGTEPH